MLESNPDLINKFLSTDLDALKAHQEKLKQRVHNEFEEVQDGEEGRDDDEDGDVGSGYDNDDQENDSAQEYQDNNDNEVSGSGGSSDEEPEPPVQHQNKKRAAPNPKPTKTAKRPRIQQAESEDALPAVTAGRSKELHRPLPPRRQSGATPGQRSAVPTTAPAGASSTLRPKTPPPAVQGADGQPVTPGRPAQHAQTPVPPPAAGSSNASVGGPTPVETPYNRRVNPRRQSAILENSLSPTSRHAFDSLKTEYLVFVLTENGFPTLDDTLDYLKAHLPAAFAAAHQVKKKQRTARASDPEFNLDMGKLLHSKSSGVRNHLINAAKDIVVAQYKLDTFKTGRDRKREVKRLLNRSSFVHTDPTNTDEGMFEHPAIRAVIEKAFFRSSKPSYNLGRVDKFKKQFDPLPTKLIILATVAIKCALDQWKDGVFSQVDFDGNVYGKEYRTLAAKLTEFLDEPDTNEYFFLLRADWYDEARSATAVYSSESEAGDDSDQEAVMAKNRTAVRAALASRRALEARAAAETRDDDATNPGRR